MEKKQPGPVPIYNETMQHVGLRLPTHLIDKAKYLGQGRLSLGVRLALEQADNNNSVN